MACRFGMDQRDLYFQVVVPTIIMYSYFGKLVFPTWQKALGLGISHQLYELLHQQIMMHCNTFQTLTKLRAN